MKRRSKAGGKVGKAGRRLAASPQRPSPFKANPRGRSAAKISETEISRLTRDRDDALEREKASAEVLRVISTSPGDLEPVFQAMLENAVRICDAKFGIIYRWDGEALHLIAAHHDTPRALVEARRRTPHDPAKPNTVMRAMLATKGPFQVADATATAGYIDRSDAAAVAAVELGGVRTTLAVPMLKEHELIGSFTVYRQEVRPFTKKQIELLQNFAAQAVIAIENTRLLNELRQRTTDLTVSLEQQTATSEVLRVISSSPTNVQPVLDTIVRTAVSLCNSYDAVILLRERKHLRIAAHHGPMALDFEWLPLGRDFVSGRTVIDGVPVHVPDFMAAGAEFPRGRKVAKRLKQRTVLGLPLRREGRTIGCLFLRRTEVLPFTDKQIELLTTFADQAVIAVENVRLFEAEQQRTRELSESLEQQTATSEVLKVISSSPGELQPVFQAMLENATRICEANFGNLVLYDGELFRRVALHNAPAAWAADQQKDPRRTRDQAPLLYRLLDTKEPVHLADVAEVPGETIHKFTGARSLLLVPMLKDNELIGGIGIYRQEVRPFSDKQVELLKNFAAQAVIAIENARLLNELRQSLEQQTATANVLRTISTSPGELEPVFDAMLDNATRLCEANFGILYRFDATGTFRAVALRDAPPAFAEFQQRAPIHATPASGLGRIMSTRQPVHIIDTMAEQRYVNGDSYAVTAVKLSGSRTLIFVPMVKDGELVGAIAIYRKEVRPFTEKQIGLLINFAAQAVIAIENTRLLNELRESLQQQTATADVLKVISGSPGDLGPVFSAMLENATRICEANFGVLYRFHGRAFHFAAEVGSPPEYAEFNRRRGAFQPIQGAPLERAMLTKQVCHSADEANSAIPGIAARLGGARTQVVVPMLKDDELIGAIIIYRQEVRPFTDKQIELLSNFAAQAVIAIENTRLLNELRESLQQQTATADVLKVISRSTFELQTVLNTLVESAARLCNADSAAIYRPIEGGFYLHQATYGYSSEYIDYMRLHPLNPHRGSVLGRVVLEQRVVHVEDVLADPAYQLKEQRAIGGYRTALGVPLMREGSSIGVIVLSRSVVKPFTDKQIELVTTFADQAAIAIENTRLFQAEQQRTRELSESLEQQTATSEVLKVISSSPGKLEPVFDAMLENAVHICDASFGNLLLYDGNLFRHVALHNAPPAWAAERERDPVPPRDKARILYGVAETKQVAHIADMAGENPDEPISAIAGARTVLIVPMLKDGELVGAIAIYRREVRRFTDKQVELVKNFAAQAVIAIENTRLLNELRQRTDDLTESLEQQTATSEVLKVISSSPGELEPVFRAMLKNAVRICEAKAGNIYRREDGALRLVATHNTPPEFAEFLSRTPLHATANNPVGRMQATKSLVHTADLAAQRPYLEKSDPAIVAAVNLGECRTQLSVPLLTEGEFIGAITLWRGEVRPFEDKQIELVKNFAAQAVIAIENTRLLNELRESLEQQTATSEVLQVISSTPGELAPVFEAILANATRICEAKFGTLTQVVDGSPRLMFQLGVPSRLEAYWRHETPRPSPHNAISRVITTGEAVHVADLQEYPAYLERDPLAVAGVELGGIRTLLVVPMLKDDKTFGTIGIYRQEVRPFTDKQIELVSNFAAQAAIAIENTRLLNELRQRTDDLSKSLDDLRTAQDRLVQTQKLASLGQLTAGIAHEIKNPLNFVNNFSGVSVELIDELQEAVKHGTFDDKTLAEVAELTGTLRENLDKIVQHGKRADSIVKNMLLHSREGSGERRAVDVNALVEESLNLAYHGARAEKQGFNVALERSFDPGAGEIDAFPQEITRVLLNLIANGFYAATKRQGHEGGNGFEPTITAATKSLGDRVEIRIRDNGIGIPPEVREKMFNPFFTTKPAGEGTGLGLSISHDIIVKQHAGSIEVDTEPGSFTEFRITLPRTVA